MTEQADRQAERIRELADEARAELPRAVSIHAPQRSAHEGYAVLLEEVDELWDEVKKRSEKRDMAAMRKECIQIAAMVLRMVHDVVDPALRSCLEPQTPQTDPAPKQVAGSPDFTGLIRRLSLVANELKNQHGDWETCDLLHEARNAIQYFVDLQQADARPVEMQADGQPPAVSQDTRPAAEVAYERACRIYYQDIAYNVCNQLDKATGRSAMKGTGIVCGTVDEPSRQAQDVLREVLMGDREEYSGTPATVVAEPSGQDCDLARKAWQAMAEVGPYEEDETNAIAGVYAPVLAALLGQLAAKRDTWQLWECPSCGFGMSRDHADSTVDAPDAKECPSCQCDTLRDQLAVAESALTALRSELAVKLDAATEVLELNRFWIKGQWHDAQWFADHFKRHLGVADPKREKQS